MNKDSAPTKFCDVQMEFEDERVLDLQEASGGGYALRSISNLLAGVTNSTFTFSHRHETDRIIAILDLSFFGTDDAITKESAIERATLSIMSWLRDEGCGDAEFTNVMLRIGKLGIDAYQDVEVQNMTIEARAIEVGLRELDRIDPSDFS